MTDKDLLRQLYKKNIKEIKQIEDLSIKYNMLDEQEYLNWKDELNKLSIDLDRD